MISIAWFAKSLLIYCLLDRPIWEKTIWLGITIFIFIWFCVSTIRKRKPKSNSDKRSDVSMLDEHLQELKGVLDEIDEELSEAPPSIIDILNYAANPPAKTIVIISNTAKESRMPKNHKWIKLILIKKTNRLVGFFKNSLLVILC